MEWRSLNIDGLLSPCFPSLFPLCVFAEESQGEIEVKDPCACESLVEFQQATMSSLEQLTQKHILCFQENIFNIQRSLCEI